MGSSVDISGTDTAGTVTVVSGAPTNPSDPAPTSGVVCEITFTQSYAAEPKIVISANNGASARLGAYVERTATGFKIVTDQPLAQNTTYSFDYIIIGAEN